MFFAFRICPDRFQLNMDTSLNSQFHMYFFVYFQNTKYRICIKYIFSTQYLVLYFDIFSCTYSHLCMQLDYSSFYLKHVSIQTLMLKSLLRPELPDKTHRKELLSCSVSSSSCSPLFTLDSRIQVLGLLLRGDECLVCIKDNSVFLSSFFFFMPVPSRLNFRRKASRF